MQLKWLRVNQIVRHCESDTLYKVTSLFLNNDCRTTGFWAEDVEGNRIHVTFDPWRENDYHPREFDKTKIRFSTVWKDKQ